MSALTKILIVLQLVFSVAVSVLLVLMISRQQNYKDAAAAASGQSAALTAMVTAAKAESTDSHAQISKAEAAKAQAETELAKLRGEANAREGTASARILGLEGDVKAKETQIAGLSAALSVANNSLAAKDKELDTLRPQVTKSITEINELTRRNNEQENQIRADTLAIKKLQEAAVQGPSSGAAAAGNGQVQMMSSGAASSAAVNAKITNVLESAGRTLIEMPLGSRDGITQNSQLFIYRSSGYVADAVVERVTPTASVAVVTRTKDGQTVQTGDTISTVGK